MEGEIAPMITSMTGFGRRQGVWRGGTVSVEVRSVNHRFLEIGIRLPKPLGHLEEIFKKAIQGHCARGRIDLSVFLQSAQGGRRTLQLDLELAKQYHHALRTLQRVLKLGGSIDIQLLAGFREIIGLSDQPKEEPKLAKLIQRLVVQAVRDLVGMRKKEGRLIARDIKGRLANLRALKKQVANRAPSVAQEAFERMNSRIEKLIGGEAPEVTRLHQELAIYADRCDITEELVRLDAHMVQFEQAMHDSGPVGKKLDFLVQEMGREINTIGSKANDRVVSAAVIPLKAELERIREQVQNVE